MKLFIPTLFVLLFMSLFVDVYSQSWLDNKHIFSFGMGTGTTSAKLYDRSFQDNDNYKATISSGYHVKYEWIITTKIRFALSFSSVNIRGTWSGTEKPPDYSFQLFYNPPDPNAGSYRVTSTSFVPRINWSLIQKEKIELYLGFGFGYRYDNYRETIVNNDVHGIGNNGLLIPISFEGSIGVRGYVSQNIGLFSEFGFAKSFFQAGIFASF